MKLYREVKASGDCMTFYTPRGVPIHLEPYELPTEEEIREIIEDTPKRYGRVYDAEAIAKAITNLLKGER